jgi:hypothetical protein
MNRKKNKRTRAHERTLRSDKDRNTSFYAKTSEAAILIERITHRKTNNRYDYYTKLFNIFV